MRPIRWIWTPILLAMSMTLCSDAARILLMAPFGGKSIKNIFYGTGKMLVEDGHEVVFFNSFKPKSPVPGIKEIVPDEMAELYNEKKLPNVFEMLEAGPQTAFQGITKLFTEGPVLALASKEMDAVLKEEWDLIIYAGFSYPYYFISHLKKVPFMIMTPVGHMPFISSSLGNPTLPASHPFTFSADTDEMSFLQRVKGFLAHAVAMVVMRHVYAPYCDRLVAAKFGAERIPSAVEMERNASLLMLSSHPTMDYHRPLLPNTVEVGGIHCQQPKPLPAEIQKFLGDSEFVFFCLGSVIRSEDMPKAHREAVLQALGSLPYKVLLKWHTSDRSGMPNNVFPSTWLPQQDILGDSKCRLFITHGGVASLQEAVCHGVPMVMMPVFADQMYNAERAVKFNMAEQLQWKDLTADSLQTAIQAALSKEHAAAAKYRQRIFTSQPVHPRDLVRYYVQQTLEHGGLPHLRSVAADLNVLQYYSLDVIAFLLVVIWLVLKVLKLVLKALLKCMCCVCCCCRCCPRRRKADIQPQPAPRAKKSKKHD